MKYLSIYGVMHIFVVWLMAIEPSTKTSRLSKQETYALRQVQRLALENQVWNKSHHINTILYSLWGKKSVNKKKAKIKKKKLIIFKTLCNITIVKYLGLLVMTDLTDLNFNGTCAPNISSCMQCAKDCDLDFIHFLYFYISSNF